MSHDVIYFPSEKYFSDRIYVCPMDPSEPSESRFVHRSQIASIGHICNSCMSNMANIIKSHNTKIQRKPRDQNDETSDMKCNCRVKPDCPLNGECKSNNIVYEATVTAEDQSIRNYIGMTEHSFKTRYADHKQSFEKTKYAKKTSVKISIKTYFNPFCNIEY